MKKATLSVYSWAVFVWCALFPVLAEAQAIPKEFKGAVEVGKALILTCQVFAGLYLAKGTIDVGMAYKHANPQARQMRDDLGLAALYVFAGAGIMEWVKRSIVLTT
jgi:hypothetical protein